MTQTKLHETSDKQRLDVDYCVENKYIEATESNNGMG